MKLFTPTEVKKKKDEIRLQETTVGLNLAKKVDELRRKSSIEELKAKESTLKLEQDFLARFHALETKEKALQKEVETLEGRRKILLQPIEEIEKQAEEKRKHAEKLLVLANEQRAELDARQESLSEKTILITEKTDELHEYEQKLKQNFLDVERQKELADVAIQRADLVWKEMTDRINTINKGLDERAKKIIEQEQTILLQRKFLEEKELEMQKERLHMESQQQTLKVAFEELRNKSK